MALGKSKVGKSTLINKIQKMNEQLQKSYFNIIEKISFLDENKEVVNIFNNIIDYLSKTNNFNDQNNSIWCIWYFITGTYFDQKEIDLLKILKNYYKDTIPIIIIYTQAINISDYNKVLHVYEENGLNLIPVLAEKVELFSGSFLEAHGIYNLLRETLDTCKTSFKNIIHDILNYIILNIKYDFSNINRNYEKNNFHQIIDDFKLNYKNVLKRESFIEFITNILFKKIISWLMKKI